MITDMKRDCIGSHHWKYIDHDRTMTISQWIEELINHSEEDYILLITIFDKEQDDKFLIRIDQHGVNFPKSKYYDYCSRKVFCAKWRFGAKLGFLYSSGTIWNILLYI